MPLQLHNTLTKQKEPFEPAHPKVVRIYTCGLTTYAPMHIGPARTY
jgi:cysteinyl-tRNA synthetase